MSASVHDRDFLRSGADRPSSSVKQPVPRSASGRRLDEQIRRFARDRTAPILLYGETGTGKTTVARQLHDLSPRSEAPFEHVVLSASSDSLAASELFGHVAGAYTDARRSRIGRFSSAHRGTLFLDEIGKASPVVQGLVLDAIESGVVRPLGADRDLRVDVRVVAASTVDLSVLVKDNRFLPDLYARIEMFRIRVPPLRERRADIPDLIDFYRVRKAASAGYEKPPAFDVTLVDAMVRSDWPGNLRELGNAVHRLLIEAEGAPTIGFEHCRDRLAFLRDESGVRDLTLRDIEHAIASHGNNVTRAASALGIDRTTLHRKRRALRGPDAPNVR